METLKYKFLEIIPDIVENGILYISMDRRVAIHLCVCGCGNEVVTPISPTDWELRYYGNAVSLYPSIGNWEFPCKSHYWIIKNEIRHAGKWSKKEIQIGKKQDKKQKEDFYKLEKVDSNSKPLKKSRWKSWLVKLLNISI